MAKNYSKFSYFQSRPDIVKLFEDLEAYLDFCRIEARKFDPADLYNRHSKSYGAFLASKRPYQPRPYLGKKPWNGKKQQPKK